jgi:hypothetical protein
MNMISYQSPRRAALVLLAICNVFLWQSIHVNAQALREPNSFMRAAHGRVKGRRLSETIYAWKQFEQSLAQERKKEDKWDESNPKDCEKMRDKHGITCTPSAQPSSAPSLAPSISHAPSISSAPSLSPSISPTSRPTTSPSVSPTGQPSVSPTLFPTHEPVETLVLTRDDGSVWQDNTCRKALPAGASQPQSEATTFEYFLQITTGADVNTRTSQVEQALVTALAERVLNTCEFGNSDTFETYGVTSLPIDEVSQDKDCPEDVQVEGADCYVITGGFTPTIFYVHSGRRQMRFNSYFSSQTQSEIVATFGPILQELLDSEMFISGDILKTTYSGFLLNENAQGNQPQLSGGTIVSQIDYGDGPSTAAIQGDASASNNNGDDGTPTGYVVGAIVICLALIALIVVSAVLLQRRKDAMQKREFEMCEDDGGLELDAAIEIDTEALPSKYDTRSVQEGLPERHPGDARSHAPRQKDAESVRSGSYTSGGFGTTSLEESTIDARRAVSGLRYSVVNDEATYDQSMDMDTSQDTDPHDYTHCKSVTCFKCRSSRKSQPIFIKADLTAIQNDLGSNKKYTPKYSRNYKTDDTVDL